MAERVRRTAREKISRVLRRLRRSMVARVTLLTAVALSLALLAIAFYVTSSVRSGMFTDSVDRVLGDAVWRVEQAQTELDQASATTVEQVQGDIQYLVSSLVEPGSGVVGAMLLRSPSEDSEIVLFEPITNLALRSIPSDELRTQVSEEQGIFWQSVSVPTQSGDVPGIIVGSGVNVPLAGEYQLFLVYSLDSEQQTLSLMMRSILGAALGLIVVTAVIVWILTWRVLRPVRQTALSAERLAAGVLDVRMPVRGEDEIATLAKSFNEMASSLQTQIQQMEELSALQLRFVSDVSHELRTPMTTMRMAADMLSRSKENLDPVARRSLELLTSQLDRFESMLADLLEISRIDAGASLAGAEEQDIRPIIQKVVEFSLPLALKAGTEVRLHGMDDTAAAVIDSIRIERIIRNLVVNAIEHCDGTPVDLWLGQNETAVSIRVNDTGVGMTEETVAHVFDRFWRADPARARTTGGTGLGLAISMEDAKLHGGTLEAWGELGVASAFLLTIPKTPGIEPHPALHLIPRAFRPAPKPIGLLTAAPSTPRQTEASKDTDDVETARRNEAGDAHDGGGDR